jgi:hypothetical protein
VLTIEVPNELESPNFFQKLSPFLPIITKDFRIHRMREGRAIPVDPMEGFISLQTIDIFGALRLRFPLVISSGIKQSFFSNCAYNRRESEGFVVWDVYKFSGASIREGVSFTGVTALIARTLLIEYLLSLQGEHLSEWPCCRRSWGNFFEKQCISCNRVYAMVFGWSDSWFPEYKNLPKVGCPQCLP